MTLTF